MLATLGVVPNAAALPANATAGPVPTSETPAPPAATRTLPPVITAPIGLARSYSYTFKLNSFRITDTRSVHNDTDFVSIAVAVGSNAPVTLPAVSMGDLNNGTYPVNISIPNIEVAAGERVAFSYSIVNTGYDQNTVEHDLSSAVASAASKAAGAGGGALAGPVGEVIGRRMADRQARHDHIRGLRWDGGGWRPYLDRLSTRPDGRRQDSHHRGQQSGHRLADGLRPELAILRDLVSHREADRPRDEAIGTACARADIAIGPGRQSATLDRLARGAARSRAIRRPVTVSAA
jgi:hypothetical protein